MFVSWILSGLAVLQGQAHRSHLIFPKPAIALRYRCAARASCRGSIEMVCSAPPRSPQDP